MRPLRKSASPRPAFARRMPAVGARTCLGSLVVVMSVVLVAQPAGASPSQGQSLIIAGAAEDFWLVIAKWLRAAIVELLGLVITVVKNSPEPDVSGNNLWFIKQYGTMFQLGLWLGMPIAIVATIHAILKGGMKELLHTFLIGVPVAILGTVAALAVITMMLKIDQEFCNLLMAKMLEDDYRTYVANIESRPLTADSLGLLGMQIIIFIVMAIGIIVLFLELVFRAVAIYMAVLFLPLGFAAYIWEATRGWYSWLAITISGLIMMKLVVVGVLALSFAAIRHWTGDAGFNQNLAPGVLDSMYTSALIIGAVTFYLAAASGPALVGMVIGNEARPAMARDEFSHYTPFSADQRDNRAQYAALIPRGFRRNR